MREGAVFNLSRGHLRRLGMTGTGSIPLMGSSYSDPIHSQSSMIADHNQVKSVMTASDTTGHSCASFGMT